MAASSSLSTLTSPAPLSLLEIEARFKGRIWRGNTLGASADPVVSSGFDELDKALPGGGWPARNLTELLLPAAGLGEIRLLSHALAQITGNGRCILLVAPPYIPYMHAWENLGLDSRHIVIARVYKPAERLWVLEQGLRSGAFGTVMGWLPEVSQQATRRLQIISRTVDNLVFLIRPRHAQIEPSAAPLRILLGPGQGNALYVYLLKRRGTPAALPIRVVLPQTNAFSGSAPPIPASIPSHC